MAPSRFRLAGVQCDVTFADVAANLEKLEAVVAQTTQDGADRTDFPECLLTGYCFESLDEARPHAESLSGNTVARLTELCGRLQTHVVTGLLEADGDHLFNACVCVGPDGVIGAYRKIHLPFLGVDRFVAAGDRPFAVHDVRGVKIGMNICYDGSFPESSRILALEGADLILLPTNWPQAARCNADWTAQCRAMENNVYYAAINRIGTERGIGFVGTSRICQPNGSVVAEALHQEEAILWADIDVQRARNKHLVRIPNVHEIHRFRDRRPELYGRITECNEKNDA